MSEPLPNFIELPDDLPSCQRLLHETLAELTRLRQALSELERTLEESASGHEALARENLRLCERLDALLRRLYGPRRERFAESPNQGRLFTQETHEPLDEQPGEAIDEPDPQASAEPNTPRVRRRGHGRRRLPEHLERRRIVHDVSEDLKQCPCCGRAKACIGEDSSEQLDYEPAKLYINVHVRPKYACSHCKEGVASAPPPPSPIERGLPGPGLLAQVIVSKHYDHLPLYRQEDILTRHGVQVPRSTLCDWSRESAELCLPLVELMTFRLLSGDLLWTDDTPVRALSREADQPLQSRFWVYVGDERHPYHVFDYTVSRERDGPRRFLQGFRGHLHADAYGGYDGIYLDSLGAVLEVGCWAHARRKFYDQLHNAPRLAPWALARIRELYDLEDRACDWPAAERWALRQREAVPILDRFHAWLLEHKAKALPKSGIAEALGYALNQWEALRRYTEDGRLSIDNNVSERALRSVALGRKNWLFVGSDGGGRTAAIHFTLLSSARRHRLEPWSYLRDVLATLSCDRSADALERLLPDVWAQSHPELILNYREQESQAAAERRRFRRERRRGEPAAVSRGKLWLPPDPAPAS